jgi:hypothetical protein
MVQVKILQNYKEYKKGQVYTLNNNSAHSLIDKNIGILYNISIPKYSDKMMRPKK